MPAVNIKVCFPRWGWKCLSRSVQKLLTTLCAQYRLDKSDSVLLLGNFIVFALLSKMNFDVTGLKLKKKCSGWPMDNTLTTKHHLLLKEFIKKSISHYLCIFIYSLIVDHLNKGKPNLSLSNISRENINVLINTQHLGNQ